MVRRRRFSVTRSSAARHPTARQRYGKIVVGDDAGRRFRWLIAPRSTVVQPSAVHSGLTADPAAPRPFWLPMPPELSRARPGERFPDPLSKEQGNRLAGGPDVERN